MKSVTPPVNTDRRRGRGDGHREQRRAELTAAAIEAIRQHGPEVGMDAIAAHAGVSKPVLYRYFADKSELWLAVGQRAGALVLEAMVPAVASVREERADQLFASSGVNGQRARRRRRWFGAGWFGRGSGG